MPTYFIKYFILFISLFALNLNGQKVVINDSESNQPVSFVTVTQMDSDVFAISDINGFVDISDFDTTKQYVFYIIGYTRKEVSKNELTSNNYTVLLSPHTFVIEPIIISTSRWSQTNGEDPFKIARISNKEVALQNPQTAADMLGTSGEIFIQKSQQGGGSPMIRGFSANRLLYAIDGVRMNNAIFRSGNLQNVISIDPLALERTEVIFGPGSVSYGSDAIGGVMTFETKTPDLVNKKSNGSALIRYSSANQEITTHGDLAYGNKKWSALTSLTYNHYGDLRMGSKNGDDSYLNLVYAERINNEDKSIQNPNPLIQKNTGFDQYNFMQKIRFRPNNDWDFQLGAHFSTTSDYGRYDRLVLTSDGVPRSAEWNYGPQEWLMTNLQVFHNSQSRFFDKSITRLAYQKFGESRHDRDFGDSIQNNRSESVDAISLNIDLLKLLGPKTQISYGLESVYNKVVSEGNSYDITHNSTTKVIARYPNSVWNSNAAFANISHKVTDRFLIDGGFRINYFDLNARFDTTLFSLPFEKATLNKNFGYSGSIGLAYRPDDSWYFAFNASTGFRSPNVDDLGKIFDSTPGSVVVPNPNLSPEDAYNIEASITKVFFGKIRFDLTGYYTILLDGMVRRDYTFNGQDSLLYDGVMSRVQSTINAAKINVKGIQSGLEIQLPNHVKLLARINIQQGDEELDDGSISPTRHASPAYGLVRLSKKFNKFYLELNTFYSAGYSFAQLPTTEIEKDYLYAKDSSGNPYSPSWFTLNALAVYNISDSFSANLKVENMLDKQYRPYSSGLVAAGRGVTLSFMGNF